MCRLIANRCSGAGSTVVLSLFFVLGCFLFGASASVADHHAGEEAAAACVSDCKCPSGQLCSPQTGQCYVVHCPLIFDPVCGLDGKTYGNACEARAAHIVIASEGACPEVCGGIQGKKCPDENQVCDLPPGQCKGRDLQGVCKTRPEVCTREFAPVCGCDGKTYGNDCMRLKAGVQKAHDGECRDGDDAMACRSNADCPQRAYCEFVFGVCEGKGRCEPRPDVCPQIFLPVCGCDGTTYSNACMAATAGVSVKSDGECQ